jgi:hypothetical protein
MEGSLLSLEVLILCGVTPTHDFTRSSTPAPAPHMSTMSLGLTWHFKEGKSIIQVDPDNKKGNREYLIDR